MDRLSLLKLLQRDGGFAATLSRVALHECAVRLCTSASEEAPSAAEAAAASALLGAKTLGALAASLATVAHPGAYLFVHVALPTGSLAASVQRELRRRPNALFWAPPPPPARSHWLAALVGGTPQAIARLAG
jgi:hypothetical protein